MGMNEQAGPKQEAAYVPWYRTKYVLILSGAAGLLLTAAMIGALVIALEQISNRK